MDEGGRSGVAWRLALTAVAIVALVVPGRMLASSTPRTTPSPRTAGRPSRPGRAVGETWRVDAGVLAKDRGSLVLVEVRPRVVVRHDRGRHHGDAVHARGRGRSRRGARARAGRAAARWAMVTGARARLRPGGPQIVVSVTPRQSGRLEVDGYDVTYVDADDRRTTEHAGRGFRLRVA